MNYQIRLTKAEPLELGRNVCICDLCWLDAGYALEYCGREWHSGTQSVAKDARRQSDLHYHGIDIDIVTYEQIETRDQVGLLAMKIARRLGVYIRTPTDRCLAERQLLHETLVEKGNASS